MKRIMYNTAVAGSRIWILEVEMQKDETAKIRKVILDTKQGNEAYRQYKIGEFYRFPPDTYSTKDRVIKMTFEKIGWLVNL